MLQTIVLCRSLVCKFGGVKIMQFCRLVKSGVAKTCGMVGRVGWGEVEKEGCDDLFLSLFAE